MTSVVNPIHPSQRRLRRQDNVLPTKSMKSVGTNCVSYGFMSVIGKQRVMEDAVTMAPGFVVVGELDTYDFFAVYDGYGGDKVSNACRDRMHRLVVEEVEKGKLGEEIQKGVSYWEKVMTCCFKKMDEEVAGGGGGNDVDLAAEFAGRTTVGSTALAVLVGKEEVVVANCGDSRVVLSRAGVALPLSNDHKPNRPDEQERIEATTTRSGRILNWNVNHILDVLGTSRSIGDRTMKPYVTAEPEVKMIERTERDEFLVLASNGLWDVISDDFACEVVGKCFFRRYLKNCGFIDDENNCAAEAAAMLTELAMARGSRENISVIVVELKTSNM